MQDGSIRVLLLAIPLIGLFFTPHLSVANDDWRSDHFYEKLKGSDVAQDGLFGGEFSRIHGSSYYPRRGIDPRHRLYGGRNYYRNDYYRGHNWKGGGHRPWYGRKPGGWHRPPRYGYGGWQQPPRYGYDRDHYYRRHHSPW